MLTEENSIISQSQKAKKQTKIASEKERVELAVTSATLNSTNYKLTTDKLEEELQKEFKGDYGTLSEDNGWNYIGKSEIFHISDNGNVSVGKQILNYKIYGNSNDLLPKEYQQVEYIESTGTQYIDTEYFANGDSKYIFKYSDNKINGVMFGAYNNNWETGNGFYINATKDNYNPFLHYFSNTRISTTYNDCGIICIDKGTYFFNDIKYTSLPTRNFSINFSTYIFAGNWGGTRKEQYTMYKLHYFYIYNNNDIVRQCIPAYRINTKEIGLYDTVENKFYINKGTGEFKKGKIVGVGNPNENGNYELPLKIITPTSEVSTTITLNSPLRKVGNTADYIDLKNKKIVRYISENSEILDTPNEESFEIDNLPNIKDILSIEVLTDIQPSKIETCE